MVFMLEHRGEAIVVDPSEAGSGHFYSRTEPKSIALDGEAETTIVVLHSSHWTSVLVLGTASAWGRALPRWPLFAHLARSDSSMIT
jgi:hypothetical protein